MKIKISYYTPYATRDVIDGYVLATVIGNTAYINKRQYKRAINNLTIGGVVPQFNLPYWILCLRLDGNVLYANFGGTK